MGGRGRWTPFLGDDASRGTGWKSERMTLGLPDLYRGESMRLYHLLFAVLTILLSGALSPAHAEWQEASSRHFLVYGDVSARQVRAYRSEEHTSELQSLMRISYAVFCLKKKKTTYSYNLSVSQ